MRRLKEASFIVQLPKNGLKNEKILNLVDQFVHLSKINRPMLKVFSILT